MSSGPPLLCAWGQSFQLNFWGPISPVVPVIQPPRASAKDWPVFVFQQLMPSCVEWQA